MCRDVLSRQCHWHEYWPCRVVFVQSYKWNYCLYKKSYCSCIKATVSEIYAGGLQQIPQPTWGHLLPKYIRFPSFHQQQQYIDECGNKWVYPSVLEQLMDPIYQFHHLHCVTLITIIVKGWYSVLIQAVVDYKYCFLDIHTRWPFSVHDACVLAQSTYQKCIP